MRIFLVDFWAYLRNRKKYWLVPALLASMVLGGLLALAEGTAVAPFIYTLF
jgi:hypothetical protein